MTPDQVSSNQSFLTHLFHFRNYEMLDIPTRKTEQKPKENSKRTMQEWKLHNCLFCMVFLQHSNIKWHIRPTESSVSQILLTEKLTLQQEICTSSTHGLRWDLIFQGLEFTKDSASILISFPLRAVHHNIRHYTIFTRTVGIHPTLPPQRTTMWPTRG